MSTKYKITITKVEEVETTRKGDWVVVDRPPWNAKRLGEASNYEDRGEFLKRNPLDEVWGHAPDVVTTKQVETEVLVQTVDTLDLAAVIKAVNGI